MGEIKSKSMLEGITKFTCLSLFCIVLVWFTTLLPITFAIANGSQPTHTFSHNLLSHRILQGPDGMLNITVTHDDIKRTLIMLYII